MNPSTQPITVTQAGSIELLSTFNYSGPGLQMNSNGVLTLTGPNTMNAAVSAVNTIIFQAGPITITSLTSAYRLIVAAPLTVGSVALSGPVFASADVKFLAGTIRGSITATAPISTTIGPVTLTGPYVLNSTTAANVNTFNVGLSYLPHCLITI